MDAKEQIAQHLKQIVRSLTKEEVEPEVNPDLIGVKISPNLANGDYYTNVALRLNSILTKKPIELAEKITEEYKKLGDPNVAKVEAVNPGFINFFVSNSYLSDNLIQILEKKEDFGKSDLNAGRKIMVEYAHPNTHKEMHIGHMRTLITGESIARIYEVTGATVFRANYQGDIGPHVAKALYGIQKIMRKENLSIENVASWSSIERAHFLGKGYVVGNQDYATHKKEIDDINEALYTRDKKIWDLYEKTRKWNLEYYDEFYKRFYTHFDRLFFESQMDEAGKKIVMEHVGSVFIENDGAIIFKGETWGLHTRVFVTAAGNPTYEGKEMANAYSEYNAFPFDLKIHVVANEQSGYFQVVFKALELIDPDKFAGKQIHLSMGMVHLSDRKMSSRTGDVLTVDVLINEVKKRVEEVIAMARISKRTDQDIIEPVTIGAIKYSVLKQGTSQDVAFSIDSSVALDGNSGPYIQYTYVRTQSILQKAGISSIEGKNHIAGKLEKEEEEVVRLLIHFPEVVESAASNRAPNEVANYLFILSQAFNLFYQKHSILAASDQDVRAFRLMLTSGVGQVIKNGLNLLGIETVDKM